MGAKKIIPTIISSESVSSPQQEWNASLHFSEQSGWSFDSQYPKQQQQQQSYQPQLSKLLLDVINNSKITKHHPSDDEGLPLSAAQPRGSFQFNFHTNAAKFIGWLFSVRLDAFQLHPTPDGSETVDIIVRYNQEMSCRLVAAATRETTISDIQCRVRDSSFQLNSYRMDQ